MTITSATALVSVSTAFAGLLASMLGIVRYFNYRTRRDRVAELGTALDQVVAALGSDNEVQRAAAAIRIRRFFDRRSELGVAGAAYSVDALNVSAAVLRGMPSGNLQKLLADGLAHAPTLAGADLQRTNLRNAYLADVSFTGADLFQADLSGGSLKRSDAREATFYRSQLAGTVFVEADLRQAIFFEANLRGADFTGATLTGATFTRCENLPPGIADGLDSADRYLGTTPFAPPRLSLLPVRVFISKPFVVTADQAALVQTVVTTIEAVGAEVVALGRTESPSTGVLSDIRHAMSSCHGVVVVGLCQLTVGRGRARAGTHIDETVADLALATPWNHAEAGIARGLGLPILRIRGRGIRDGVFDPTADVQPAIDLDDPEGVEHVQDAVDEWVRSISSS